MQITVQLRLHATMVFRPPRRTKPQLFPVSCFMCHVTAYFLCHYNETEHGLPMQLEFPSVTKPEPEDPVRRSEHPCKPGVPNILHISKMYKTPGIAPQHVGEWSRGRTFMLSERGWLEEGRPLPNAWQHCSICNRSCQRRPCSSSCRASSALADEGSLLESWPSFWIEATRAHSA